MDELELFQRLGLALALGLLMGIERGWRERGEAEGERVAGLRTFGLSGLLGGVWAAVSQSFGEMAGTATAAAVLLGLAFAGFAGAVIALRLRAARRQGDLGATTLVAVFLTFALGAFAVLGNMQIAAAGAVAATFLLGLKPALHGWLTRLQRPELMAALELLVMTVILLPLLPDRALDPWQLFNPYRIWLMVILIAGVSFAGYIAIRTMGPDRGVLLSGLAGGLVSSTAVTISFARLARQYPASSSLFAAGVSCAAVTMYPRMLLVAAVIEPRLLLWLALPLLLATAAGSATVALRWPRQEAQPGAGPTVKNPFELLTAIKFGLLLAAVLALVRLAQDQAGVTGIYGLAIVAGLGDVDAITLSLAQLTGEALAAQAATIGILLAALSNTLVKVAISFYAGGRSIGLAIAPVLAASFAGVAIGLAIVLLWPGNQV